MKHTLLYRVVADPSGECGEAKNWHFKGLTLHRRSTAEGFGSDIIDF